MEVTKDLTPNPSAGSFSSGPWHPPATEKAIRKSFDVVVQETQLSGRKEIEDTPSAFSMPRSAWFLNSILDLVSIAVFGHDTYSECVLVTWPSYFDLD